MNAHILFRNNDILVTPAMARFGPVSYQISGISSIAVYHRPKLNPIAVTLVVGGLRPRGVRLFRARAATGLQPVERDRGAGRADPRCRLAADAPGPRIPAGDEVRRQPRPKPSPPSTASRCSNCARRSKAPSTCSRASSRCAAACAGQRERRRPRRAADGRRAVRRRPSHHARLGRRQRRPRAALRRGSTKARNGNRRLPPLPAACYHRGARARQAPTGNASFAYREETT